MKGETAHRRAKGYLILAERVPGADRSDLLLIYSYSINSSEYIVKVGDNSLAPDFRSVFAWF
jgi:hypothetical protein